MLSKMNSSNLANETRCSLGNNSAEEIENDDEEEEEEGEETRVEAEVSEQQNNQDEQDDEINSNEASSSSPSSPANHDANNNNSQSSDNNNHRNESSIESSADFAHQIPLRKRKKSKVELLDIVELSRKRRLSKDSANSLTSFIRWSFSHFEPSQIKLEDAALDHTGSSPEAGGEQAQVAEQSKRKLTLGSLDEEAKSLSSKSELDRPESDTEMDMKSSEDAKKTNLKDKNELEENEGTNDDDDEVEDDDDELEEAGWLNLVRREREDHRSNLFNSPGGGAEQLLLRSRRPTDLRHLSSSQIDQLAGSESLRALQQQQLETNDMILSRNALKRSRVRALDGCGSGELMSQELQLKRKFSTGLSNVVDRLHLSSQQSASLNSPLVEPTPDQSNQQAAAAAAAAAAAGLSYNLQQFLQQQQQGAIEDLCSSGPEINQAKRQPNSQLALAAVRALIDSCQNSLGSSQQDSKSVSSSSGSSGSQLGSQQQTVSSNSLSSAIQSPLLSQLSQQQTSRHVSLRRAYNTRAANLIQQHLQQQQQLLNHHQQQQQVQGASPNTANLGLGGQQQVRVQQARHAQAAATLSALASAAAAAGSPSSQLPVPLNGSHLHHSHHQNHDHHQSASSHLIERLAKPLSGGTNHQQLSNSAASHLSPFLNASQQQQLGQLHSPMIEFKCDTCPSSFDDRHRLMQHQSIHLELKKDWFTETPVDEVMKIFNRRRGEFLCNLCNLRFEATLDFDQHNHQVHGPRPYCCQFCGNGTRTFKSWRQYLNHLYDHRYIFSCTINDCDFSVNRRDSLRFHIFRFHLNCQLPQNEPRILSNIQATSHHLHQSPQQHQLNHFQQHHHSQQQQSIQHQKLLAAAAAAAAAAGQLNGSGKLGSDLKWAQMDMLDLQHNLDADDTDNDEMNVAD